MDATPNQIVEERPDSTEQTVAAAPPEVDALRRQRIRFDGLFTGPTW
jgi:hypothetical protein